MKIKENEFGEYVVEPCEYCDGGLVENLAPYTHITFQAGFGRGVFTAYGSDIVSISVPLCPWCGRYLGDS